MLVGFGQNYATTVTATPSAVMRVSGQRVMVSGSVSPTQVCSKLASLLVQLVSSDPSGLCPPAEEFSPINPQRACAGKYVINAASPWRTVFRNDLRTVFNAGGRSAADQLVSCIEAQLFNLTDLTSQDLMAALGAEYGAVTGKASTYQGVQSQGRQSAEQTQQVTTSRTADQEKQITQGPPAEDVYVPPGEDVYMPPVDWGQPPPTVGEKSFPWVPVIAGVAVVGVLGVVLLTKKKRK